MILIEFMINIVNKNEILQDLLKETKEYNNLIGRDSLIKRLNVIQNIKER